MGKNKVLFVGAVWPEPSSSAGGSRLMHLIDFFLNNQFEVHYCSAAIKTPWMSDIEKIGVKVFSIVLNDTSFNEQVADIDPNVVVFDRFMMEEQFGWRVSESCPDAIRVIETVDLHCLRLARMERLKTGRELNSILLNSDIAKRELAAIYRSDFSIMISTAEMQILKDLFSISDNLLHYLPYKPANKPLSVRGFEDREGFLSIGNFKHAPNWDAVLYLKTEIFPLIKKALPKANLYVYGSYCDDKAYQLHQPGKGFHVLGRAEDAMTVMSKSKVCLAPLRFGAGIKGKLIESMLCGTPNVTTNIGAEGMKGDLNWNGFIEESASNIAVKAIDLYTDKNSWLEAQKNGYKLIENNFNPDQGEEGLLKKIFFLKSNLKSHRETNFIGSMLLHHSMQSTKFMSRWIELKNK